MPMASGRIKAPVSVSRRFGVLRNLLTSTLGNMVCGAMLVGLVYWFGYCAAPRGPVTVLITIRQTAARYGSAGQGEFEC